MIHRLSHLPIRVKLLMLLTATTAAALLAVSMVYILNDRVVSRAALTNQMQVLSKVTAKNLVAAVAFDDRETANELLESLTQEPAIQLVCIYTTDNELFTAFDAVENHHNVDPARLPQPSQLAEGTHYLNSSLEQVAWIEDETDRLGRLYIQASTVSLQARTEKNLLLIAITWTVTLLLSMIASARLERVISSPIVELAEVANHISDCNDYSVRVSKFSNDEIGVLYTSFNKMLAQIESSRDELKAARDHLEDRVHERTQQLTETNQQLTNEIAERARAQIKLQELQHQLIDTARRAGMADVATGVLHNVGNILNSVNVSAGLLQERLRFSPATSLRRSADLLSTMQNIAGPDHNHRTELLEQKADESIPCEVSALSRLEKLSEYLGAVADKCENDSQEMYGEVDRLLSNIDHIKRIVSSQQSMSKSSGLITKVNVATLFFEAIQLHDSSLSTHGIEVDCDFIEHPTLQSDEHRILQILVNLVSNAKQAVMSSERIPRTIRLGILHTAENRLQATVTDNGIGIRPSDLDKIFSYGFTTKVDGHGFGLHASALAAYELGGSLQAKSDGVGRGAQFILDLPYHPSKQEKNA